jgi:hypothetical protein
MPRGIYSRKPRTEEHKANLRAAQKEAQNRPKTKEKRRLTNAKLEVHARRSVTNKKSHNTPEYLAKQSSTLKRNRADPNSAYNTLEYKEKCEAANKKSHNTPEYLAKKSATMKEAHADPNSAYNTPEYKEANKKSHNTPEYLATCKEVANRSETKEKRRLTNAKPEVHARRSATSKRNRADPNSAYNTPEYKVKHQAANKKSHNTPEYLAKVSGTNGSNWQGGIGNLPYPLAFDKKLKKQIRNRDNNTCQLCGRTKEKEGKNLCIHHINYDKDDLFELNLISLCSSCNTKVNANRELWEDYFTFKLLCSSPSGCS